LTDSSEPDPIFAAIERHRKAYAAMQAFDAELLEELLAGTLSATKEAEGAMYEVADAEINAVRALARVVPTTLQGLLAMLVYIGDYAAENSGELLDALNAEDSNALLGSLATAAKALTRGGLIGSGQTE
jgi:hypothetical protein